MILNSLMDYNNNQAMESEPNSKVILFYNDVLGLSRRFLLNAWYWS